MVEYTELLGRTLLLPVLPKGNVGPVTLELLLVLDVLPEVVVFSVAGLARTLTPSLTLTCSGTCHGHCCGTICILANVGLDSAALVTSESVVWDGSTSTMCTSSC